MQVYKAYFKIILENLNQIIIYTVVFISLAVALANTNTKPGAVNFEETKVNIAFINYDENGALTKGLKTCLGKNTNIIAIKDDAKSLQDALFFREVEYIVKVPEGFSKSILSGKLLQLEKTAVPASTSEMYIDSLINKYLNTAKTYMRNMENLSEKQLLSYVEKDLEQKTKVELNNSAEAVSRSEKTSFYFNYLAYSLFATLILGVSCVMMVFNNSDLKKRNLCTPIKLKNMNFQLILANLSYAVLAWFVMIITSIFMYGSYMFTERGLLFLLNSLIFTFAVLSISFLIGNVVNSKGAMSAVANVFTLGTCFISGVFVPQALLGKSVLTLASFTPNYWYVKSNNSIATIANFNMENLTPIFLNMLIVIGFGTAVLAVTLAVIKQKRAS